MVDAQTVPQSAAPILASSLLGEEDLDDIIATVFRGVPQRRAGERLVAGVKSVDDVLGGGLGTGDVVGVSGSDGGGKEDVSSSSSREPGFQHTLDHGFNSSVTCDLALFPINNRKTELSIQRN